ncbi:SHOCT domain-containing protein [Pseudogracilibacillus sp. SO30301A]|uniref:SHOCT domain-containing protein n=1 Tax=Pseudogracilibacillus sp. SO30301A TaxID=3098291 RepID=UPI00300E6747
MDYFTIRLIITIIVMIALAYILIRFRTNRNSTRSSLDMMKLRMERGEITEEDYKRAKERQGKK